MALTLDTNMQNGKTYVLYFDVKGFSSDYTGTIEQKVASLSKRFVEQKNYSTAEFSKISMNYVSFEKSKYMQVKFVWNQPKNQTVHPTINGVGKLLDGHFKRLNVDTVFYRAESGGELTARIASENAGKAVKGTAGFLGDVVGNTASAIVKPLMPVVWVLVAVIVVVAVVSIVFRKEVSAVTMKAVGI